MSRGFHGVNLAVMVADTPLCFIHSVFLQIEHRDERVFVFELLSFFFSIQRIHVIAICETFWKVLRKEQRERFRFFVFIGAS